MTNSKNKVNPLIDIPLDPAVRELMKNSVYKDLMEEQALPEGKRKKKLRDKARVKGTFDLSKKLMDWIDLISYEQSVPKSQIAALLLTTGLNQLIEGQLDVSKYKKMTRSPRYEWVLELPEVPEIKGKSQKKG